MEIVADTGKCVGAGMCVLTEPRLFDQSDEEGTVLVLNTEPGGELAGKAREAVQLCPSRALSLRE